MEEFCREFMMHLGGDVENIEILLDGEDVIWLLRDKTVNFQYVEQLDKPT